MTLNWDSNPGIITQSHLKALEASTDRQWRGASFPGHPLALCASFLGLCTQGSQSFLSPSPSTCLSTCTVLALLLGQDLATDSMFLGAPDA